MGKKFKLTKETINYKGHILHRIKALKDFGNVKKGDLGGFVETKHNLSQEGSCWVYNNAKGYDNAQVYDNAEIYDYAEIYGNAEVYNNAEIYDYAEIYGNAKVYGNAKICGMARVYDNKIIFK